MGAGIINIDVSEVLGNLGKLIKDLKSLITGKIDPEKAAEIAARLQEIDTLIPLAQTEINKIEAIHPSTFVAGWRPYTGWILGTCIGIYYIPTISIGIYVWAKTVIVSSQWIPPPSLSMGELIGLILAMMGFIGSRTIEKKWGVQGNH